MRREQDDVTGCSDHVELLPLGAVPPLTPPRDELLPLGVVPPPSDVVTTQ